MCVRAGMWMWGWDVCGGGGGCVGGVVGCEEVSVCVCVCGREGWWGVKG